MIKVLIVDDESLARIRLQRLLGKKIGYRACGRGEKWP